MPYCPECHSEFQDRAQTCPDCGVALTRETPPASEPSQSAREDKPLMHIATAPNQFIADLWAAILEDNGIHCLVRRPDLAIAFQISPLNLSHEIHVLASQAESAIEILESIEEQDEALPEDTGQPGIE